MKINSAAEFGRLSVEEMIESIKLEIKTNAHEHLQSSEENLRTQLKDYLGNNSKAGAYDIILKEKSK